jgi:hypothetical protein
MDDVALSLFVTEAALALLAIPSPGQRRLTLAQLRSGLVVDLEAKWPCADRAPGLPVGRGGAYHQDTETPSQSCTSGLRSQSRPNR